MIKELVFSFIKKDKKKTALIEVAAETISESLQTTELLQRRGNVVEDAVPKSDPKGVQIYIKI